MMFVLWRISALNSNTLYFSTQSWTGNWHALISFRLRVLTGFTHIFGLRQKSRQEADPSSLLAASTSSLPLPNLQIRTSTNIQTAIRTVRKVARRAIVTALLLSAVSIWAVLLCLCIVNMCIFLSQGMTFIWGLKKHFVLSKFKTVEQLTIPVDVFLF